MNKKRAVFHWSGGKDSAMALKRIMHNPEYSVERLLTTIDSVQNRVTMHGVRKELILKQAQAIGLPVAFLSMPESSDMETYDKLMREQMNQFSREGITHAVFGDIFLEDLKNYRENQMNKCGFSSVFPIWNEDTSELMREFLNDGFKAITVSTSAEKLDKNFCGREIDKEFITDLPDQVDVCGENGEFHTFVYDGPVFKKPVFFNKGEIVYREYDSPGQPDEKTGFWFCDLLAD